MNTWINKKTAGGIFLGLILLLLFFSKTIYTYHLPQITAVKPENGQLGKVEVASGTVQWAEMDSIYIPEEGVVGELYVSEGEHVKAGQKLCAMVYDIEENEWKLQEIENTINTIQIEINNLNIQLAAAEKHLSASWELYSIGGISTVDLDEARNQISYLRLELEIKQLEIENQTLMAAPYKKTQKIHNGEEVLTAPSDGVLISFYIAKGEKVSKDVLAAKIGTGSNYILECDVSLDNNFIVPGDTCSLSNSSHQIKGMVSSVLPTEEEKNIKVRFSADDVMAGETFEVMFQKESSTSYILVPNAAVNRDQDGYFLKQVKRRDGILGKEYYLDRIDVYIGDSDSKNTAIIRGITFFEPVMLSGNKEAKTGDVVLLKNAGDFFEE